MYSPWSLQVHCTSLWQKLDELTAQIKLPCIFHANGLAIQLDGPFTPTLDTENADIHLGQPILAILARPAERGKEKRQR